MDLGGQYSNLRDSIADADTIRYDTIQWDMMGFGTIVGAGIRRKKEERKEE